MAMNLMAEISGSMWLPSNAVHFAFESSHPSFRTFGIPFHQTTVTKLE